jgi:hypothetical protein
MTEVIDLLDKSTMREIQVHTKYPFEFQLWFDTQWTKTCWHIKRKFERGYKRVRK